MLRKKIIYVLSLILLIPMITITTAAAAAGELPSYEKLMQTAQEKGYARVILKLVVKDIDQLTENSTQYKTVVPGARFPSAGFQADLELEQAIEAAAFSLLHRLNGQDYRVNHTYTTLPYLAADVSAEVLALLPSFPEVADIYEDSPLPLETSWQEEYPGKRPLEEFFTPSGTEADSPLLTDSTGLIGADDAWSMGFTGSGWYVAILDTGIRRTHQFFQGKTIVEACFSANSDCPNGGTSMYGTGAAAHYASTYKGYDHGSHVSGIAAGKYGSLAGVAKSSNIIAVQVFSRFAAEDCDGSPCVMSYSSDQVKGLEYVYSLRSSYSISSVNMSLGSGSYSSYCTSAAQKSAIDNLKSVRIATVIATGNDGYCGYIGSPACIPSAVAVGASDKSNKEAYFNNWHSTLQEFFAPGVSIYSSTGDSNSSYESWNGTSMATPHVTGAWALLRQASPSSSVDEIFNALKNTGVAIKTLCSSGGSLPLIQVDAAIDSLLGTTPALTVTSPNGGELLTVGTTHTITWTSRGTVGNVMIEYSTNNGSSWSTVVSSTSNDGAYSWLIPNTPSSQCIVRIKEASDGSPSDTSNAIFSIVTSIQTPGITVTAPNGGESWKVGSSHNITWTSTGTVGNVKIEYSTNNGSSWSTVVSSTANDGSYSWTIPNTLSTQCKVRIKEASDGSPSDTSNAVFSIISAAPAQIALSRTTLFFTGVYNSPWTVTSPQAIWLNNSGGGILNWTAASNAYWLSCSPGSGSNVGALMVSVIHSGLTAGNYSGVITVSAANTTNSPQSIYIYLKVIDPSQDSPPFGDFSTPLHGSIVSSSIPVTGWALDDVEVKSVKIYMGNTYVGDAVFVEGARPDLEASYPTYPKNHMAGWGYMLLTNFLPNGGNGVYTLEAKATDAAGYEVSLGTKTITCNNASAVKPFGAIDSPAQGGPASGSNYLNVGWVLTPLPNGIPTTGSTIDVYVDGIKLGHPTYNIYRSDIASLFPGYLNSNAAGGYYSLDTAAYDNGVHAILWVAADSGGNSDGIGSRYFTINNSGSSSSQQSGTLHFPPAVGSGSPDLSGALSPTGPVTLKTGFDDREQPHIVSPAKDGFITIEVKELERIELHLAGSMGHTAADHSPGEEAVTERTLQADAPGLGYSGYLLVGDRWSRLPVGSFLDSRKGIFYWMPGPGFVGEYRLIFMAKQNNAVRKINIKINPKYK